MDWFDIGRDSPETSSKGFNSYVMEPINNEKETNFPKHLTNDFNINWNWLYLRSHLVFALLVFVGMIFFVWWITS